MGGVETTWGQEGKIRNRMPSDGARPRQEKEGRGCDGEEERRHRRQLGFRSGGSQMEGESRREEGRVHARKAPPRGGGEMGEEATCV